MKVLLKIAIFMIIASVKITAQNPIIQTNYTADPAPMVYNDKVYLYTTHDEDNSSWFTMNDWRLYTTDDMVNWTDHGAVLAYTDFAWAKGDAWAAQCIERGGKFYMYIPVISSINNRGAIGVAVADSPYGPFYDALGKPLVQTDWGDIDPTVFIDDDGQAYMYWGNPKLKYVKLNEDMISYKGEVVTVPLTEESFGRREGNPERATLYEEGPWLYKRNKLYYLFWPGGPLPEHLGYSTSNSPIGPWKYGGTVMSAKGGVFTNHPGVIDFRGKTYLFYHNGDLPGGGGFTRSVCVDELKFNKDDSISEMKMNKEGIKKGLKTLNPYVKNEAETISWSEGVKAYQNKQVGVFVTAKKNGSYTQVKGVDFGKNAPSKFFARVASTHNDIIMEVRADGTEGELLGTIKVPRTGGDNRWELISIDVEKITGVHDLYFIFKGRVNTDVMSFDYWRFTQE